MDKIDAINRRPADLIPKFKQATVLVIGEIILDKTIDGNVTRIAPEAPVPVVHVQGEEYFLGGAANVAANVAALGGKAILIGYLGQDQGAVKVSELCADCGVVLRPAKSKEPTIQKVRVTSQGQQLVRVDYESKYSGSDRAELISIAEESLNGADVIILSDYNKGLQTPEIVGFALSSGKPVVVDPKPENLSMFASATIIHPNHLAVEKATGKKLDSEEAVTLAGTELSMRLGSSLLITRGAHGMSLIEKDGGVMHIPTQAREVYDVTGAGDSSIATVGLALACGGSLREAVILANQTAGIKVGKRGTATVSWRELLAEFEAGHTKIKTIDEIAWICENLRSRGRKIVFTNGFFDILHIGHAELLRKAKVFGDVLVLGINTDESIHRQKGDARPLIPQRERGEILSAIEAVDYVVFFDEDTPLHLVETLKPDIVVKGGTFKPDQVLEYDTVNGYGGKIEIVKLTPSKSQLGIGQGIEE